MNDIFLPKTVKVSSEEAKRLKDMQDEFIAKGKAKYYLGAKEVSRKEFYEKKPFTVEPERPSKPLGEEYGIR